MAPFLTCLPFNLIQRWSCLFIFETTVFIVTRKQNWSKWSTDLISDETSFQSMKITYDHLNHLSFHQTWLLWHQGFCRKYSFKRFKQNNERNPKFSVKLRLQPKILYKRIGRDDWFLPNQSEYSIFAELILLW